MKKILLGCAVMPLAAMPAMAADVTLTASIVSSCTLTIGSGGTMTAAASGTLLSSEQSGGSAATLNIVAVGILPTVSFSSPSLITSPSG